LEVRERLVEALKLDLVGPWAGHMLAEEQVAGAGATLELVSDRLSDSDGDAAEIERGCRRGRRPGSEIPQSAGFPEESNEERKAAKKGSSPLRWA
jgi:hypothetical protein